jgi:hypothetical protein
VSFLTFLKSGNQIKIKKNHAALLKLDIFIGLQSFQYFSEVWHDLSVELDNIIELSFPFPFIECSVDKENATFGHVNNLIVETGSGHFGPVI